MDVFGDQFGEGNRFKKNELKIKLKNCKMIKVNRMIKR